MTDETPDSDAEEAAQLARLDERRPAGFPPPATLMAIVRFLADHTDRVILGDHATDRMMERGITSEDIYRALRLGDICGRITRGKNSGEFKCKVVAKPRGSRKMGVVTIVVMNEYLFVKTVEWEDR